TERVMEAAVGYNRFMGYPLTMAGETIFANGIPLQVSEGCSGIRSFQSSVFAGFVIGEFLRLKWHSRILLVLLGAGLAFLGNCGRVIFLVHHAFQHGDENLQKLHDVSGYVSLAATLAAIVGLGLLIDKFQSRHSTMTPLAAT
ncbi:MAG: archaeosortase/exosortase family protein, partial [Verrucomicrobiota bacterium]